MAGVSDRTAHLELEQDEIVTDLRDAYRPLHIRGLSPADFAVFLSVSDTDATESVGYLVTHVDQFGDTGIIVPGDLLEQDPRTWASNTVCERIASMDPEEFGNFTLPNLHEYATRLYITPHAS